MSQNMCNILRGPTPEYKMPQVSVGRILFDSLKSQSEKEALVDAATNKYLTYKDIFLASVGLAKKLQSFGYSQNDTISIVSDNCIEYSIPQIAGFYLGLIISPSNPGYTIREHTHSMNISNPKVIFCSLTVLPAMLELQKHLDFIKLVITIDGKSSDANIQSLEEFIGDDVEVDDFEPIDVNIEEQIAIVLCSSGTTGLPKGVMQSHSNIIPAFEQMKNRQFGNLSKEDVACGLLPLFHVYGFTLQLVAIVLSVKFILVKKFETELFLSSIQKYQITNLYLVPPLMSLLAKHPLVDKYDLSCVRDIICAAAPLSKEIEVSVANRLNVKTIRQAYGMTESTFAISITPIGSKNKHGASGKMVSGLEAKIRDLNTNENLGPFKRGEICIRGQQIMMGYKNDVNATNSTLIDGWLHTGDVAYYDEDEYIFVVDRIKELIKYKGYQVPPAELESILMLHAAIKDCAVIGQPDEKSGEVPVAFVVLRENMDIKANELVNYVAERISVQKRLYGGVRFINEIPRTASGKIVRRNLKELLVTKTTGG